MSLQKSGQELKQEVLAICGELTDGTSPFDTEAMKYLNKVYLGIIAGNNLFDIDCMEPWVWAQAKYPIILTLKAKATGAATLTNASMAGTFSSAPTISLKGRFLALEGESELYRIASHTAASTSFSLDQEFLGSSGSFNYTAYKYDYDATSDAIIIDNKNCKIDFNEGGSQLTATITQGSYSPTTLAAEIKTRMDAVGAADYTITFDDITRKFTIASNGATFVLMFATGSNVHISASGVLGFNVVNQSGALTYTSAYALSGIVRIAKPITSYKSSISYNSAAKDSNKIFMLDDNSFLRDYPLNRLSTAMPDKFCIVEQNKDGLWVIRFNASVLEDTRVELNYIPVARLLQDNTVSFPLIPGNFSDILIYGAAHFLQADKSDAKATDSLQKAQAQLKALIAFNRQGSQIAGDKFGKLVARPDGSRRLFGSGSAY